MNFGFDEVEEETSDERKKLTRFLEATRHIYPTEAKFMSWLRSSFRQGFWMKHPVKMELLKTARLRIVNPRPNPRKGAETIWGYECNICKGHFKTEDVEVDHKTGEFEFKKLEDLNSYVAKLVFITPDDLQVLCKGCHKIKTYSERYGVSWNEAVAMKKAIASVNDGTYKAELVRLGMKKPVIKTKAKEVLSHLYLAEMEENCNGF